MINIEFGEQRYAEGVSVSRGTLSLLCSGFDYLFHVEHTLSVFFVLFLCYFCHLVTSSE